MEAMDVQLEHLAHRVEQCVYYRATRFFATADASASTENALWDALAEALAMDRIEAKCLFRHLDLVQSTRKCASKTRTRLFTFRWPR